jgi:hypothetical protein
MLTEVTIKDLDNNKEYTSYIILDPGLDNFWASVEVQRHAWNFFKINNLVVDHFETRFTRPRYY